MNCQNTPPSQHGFTALEIIIVLIIGFSIIGLSAGKMADMLDSSKATRALDSIVNLSTAIKSLANPQGYGALNGDMIPDLINAGVVPKSLRQHTNGAVIELLNQWNLPISIAVGATDQNTFIITYPGVPKAACNKLVKDLLSNFTVGIMPNGGAPIAVSQNATMSQIVTACSAAAPLQLQLTDL